MSPLDVGRRIACFVRGHRWQEPTVPRRFTSIPTRVCGRCGRVESTIFTGAWHRLKHAEGRVR